MAENAQHEPHLIGERIDWLVRVRTEIQDIECILGNLITARRHTPSLVLHRSDVALLSPVDFGWNNNVADRQVVGGAVDLSQVRFVTVHHGGEFV